MCHSIRPIGCPEHRVPVLYSLGPRVVFFFISFDTVPCMYVRRSHITSQGLTIAHWAWRWTVQSVVSVSSQTYLKKKLRGDGAYNFRYQTIDQHSGVRNFGRAHTTDRRFVVSWRGRHLVSYIRCEYVDVAGECKNYVLDTKTRNNFFSTRCNSARGRRYRTWPMPAHDVINFIRRIRSLRVRRHSGE